MKLSILAFAAILLVPAAGLAQVRVVRPGYADDREDVARQAHLLSERTLDLYRTLGSIRGYSHLADDARELAMIAERFHERVEAREYGRRPVGVDDLGRAYAHLRSQFYRAHDTHHHRGAVRQWIRTVASWEQLMLTMGIEQPLACRYAPAPAYPRHDFGTPPYAPPPYGRY